MSKKNQYKNKTSKQSDTVSYIKTCMILYLFLMLAVFPIYIPGGYAYVSVTKWLFFRTLTAVFSVIMAILFIRKGSVSENGFRDIIKKRRITDIFVMSYFAVCCISDIMAVDKIVAVHGYMDWYMGFWAQTFFVLAYFFISRGFESEKSDMCMIIAITALLIGSGIVFFLGIIMRFNIDPFGFYRGLSAKDRFDFISTLGQSSWYSSYLCITLPFAISGWCFSDYNADVNDADTATGKRGGAQKSPLKNKKWLKIICGVVMVLGFMSTVTQNSDSAYLAMGAYMLVFLWIAVKNGKLFERFLEVIVVCLLCFKIMGFAQVAAQDMADALDPISVFFSQSAFTLILLIIMAIILLIYKKKGLGTEGKRVVSPVFACILFGLIALIVLGGVVYIILNTRGLLPENLISDNNYLVFNDYWGNKRGIAWKSAVLTFARESIPLKLFGAGNDCFYQSAYRFFGDELKEFYIGVEGRPLILQNAHNEWLNSLINVGVLGTVAYMGIFVSAFIVFMKGGDRLINNEPASSLRIICLYGAAMAIAAYMIHNTFCYQQVICTSTIFVIMGIGMGVVGSTDVNSIDV